METDKSTLIRRDGSALWKQIADTLKQEISDAVYRAEDGRLPTERELTNRFEVNRHTVRRALASLAETGLVRTEQGRGVFVNAELVEYPLGQRVRFTESLKAMDRIPIGRITAVTANQQSLEVTNALEIKPNAAVWRVDRLGAAEDRPIAIAAHYFSKARFPNLAHCFSGHASITKALELLGVTDYERRQTRIYARPAKTDETQILDLPRGRSVLVTEGVNIDRTGSVIEFSVACFAADRVQLLA
jgi:GntR family phosphonate transport system transcriptional regulator